MGSPWGSPRVGVIMGATTRVTMGVIMWGHHRGRVGSHSQGHLRGRYGVTLGVANGVAMGLIIGAHHRRHHGCLHIGHHRDHQGGTMDSRTMGSRSPKTHKRIFLWCQCPQFRFLALAKSREHEFSWKQNLVGTHFRASKLPESNSP